MKKIFSIVISATLLIFIMQCKDKKTGSEPVLDNFSPNSSLSSSSATNSFSAVSPAGNSSSASESSSGLSAASSASVSSASSSIIVSSMSSSSSLSASTLSSSSSSSSSASGPVIHYGFENNLNDLSGNGHDGTGVGAAYTGGVTGQGLDCGSDTQKRYVYTESSLTTDYIFTYAYWVKRNSTGGFEHQLARDTVYNRLRIRSAGSADESSGAPDDSLVVELRDNNDNTQLLYSPAAMPGIGQWFHVAVVVDSTTAYLYIDGSEVASIALPGGFKQWHDSGARTTIGLRAEGIFPVGDTDSGNWFNGVIDEFYYYDKALSSSEVAALAAIGPASSSSAGSSLSAGSSSLSSSAGLSSSTAGSSSSTGGSIPSDFWAYLPMEDLNCTIDGSGSTLSAYGSTANFSFPAGGKAGNYVDAPSYATADGLQLGTKLPSNVFSLVMWIRQDVLEDQYYMIWIVLDSGASDEHRLDLNSYNDKYRFRMYNSDIQQEITFLNSGTDVWHHIALTVDASTAAADVYCYVDGIQVEHQSLSIGVALDVSAAYSWGSRIAYKADVSIDEMYIYDRILSGAEITALYNAY
ncbi:MAG TPA: LamG domain-containing protein [Spirochaetota bacterium]|nr:LamG domain-containing protein [Spirochaetota bacterium]